MLLEARHPRVVRPPSVGGTPHRHCRPRRLHRCRGGPRCRRRHHHHRPRRHRRRPRCRHRHRRHRRHSHRHRRRLRRPLRRSRRRQTSKRPPSPPPDHLCGTIIFDDLFEERSVCSRSLRMRTSTILCRPYVHVPLITPVRPLLALQLSADHLPCALLRCLSNRSFRPLSRLRRRLTRRSCGMRSGKVDCRSNAPGMAPASPPLAEKPSSDPRLILTSRLARWIYLSYTTLTPYPPSLGPGERDERRARWCGVVGVWPAVAKADRRPRTVAVNTLHFFGARRRRFLALHARCGRTGAPICIQLFPYTWVCM